MATNVETARRLIDALNAGQAEQVLGLVHPDVVWVEDPRFPGAQTWHGHDGVLASIASWRDSWSRMTLSVEEFREEGERVTAIGTNRVVGHGTELEFDTPFVSSMDFRDGKLARVAIFGSEEAAART